MSPYPEQELVFGPVPSRRLGRSLGINNIPPKVCPYSCVYCQLGRTHQLQIERQPFYPPETILHAVTAKLALARASGETIDYLTFVPDGEPTLDANLGQTIELLRPLGIPIAVITCGALLGQAQVRAELRLANWVSLKIDAAQPDTWRRLNRPHGRLRLAVVQEGSLDFAATFAGQLVTETMLIAGLNDNPAVLEATADAVARLRPQPAYLGIPTRPPAEAWVEPPTEAALNLAFQIFSSRLEWVEYLIGYEGNAFAFTGNVEADLLSITAVHPLRADAVVDFLARAGADWSVIDRLLAQGQLLKVPYHHRDFYLRKLYRA